MTTTLSNTVEMNTTESAIERRSAAQMNRFLLNTSFEMENAEIEDACLFEQYIPRTTGLED